VNRPVQVAIVGAGQSGLQLALGLVDAGCEVTLISDRDGSQIARGSVLSSQCMFDAALETERSMGLAGWDELAPSIKAVSFTRLNETSSAPPLHWSGRLDHVARSVDQRLKIPRWLELFTTRGGNLEIAQADVALLEQLTMSHDLTIVATGRAPISELFERDPGRSAFTAPQRSLALNYVRDRVPTDESPAVEITSIPGVGEYLVFPALTTSGCCEIMVFEAIPGGPMDVWHDAATPEEHLQRSLDVLDRFLPEEFERCRNVSLTDDNGFLTGSVTPIVRSPVALLPSGREVLGMADAVVLNDPLTGQGSNNAAKAAELTLESILAHRGRVFDGTWMRRTFEHYWLSYAQWVVWWTTSMLTGDPPHQQWLLERAGEEPALAEAIANGFDDPRTFYPWWFDEGEANRFIATKSARSETARFDPRELRRALAQFATGVTVITAIAPDGHRIGLTANSFTSVSLDPPLVLWCVAKNARSLAAFHLVDRFTVNVLGAHQHHLSRRFATRAIDKFEGVDCHNTETGGLILEGALAHYTCRPFEEHDAGDHVIMICEVLEFSLGEGEPLVFHAGNYRVTTRHPDVPADG